MKRTKKLISLALALLVLSAATLAATRLTTGAENSGTDTASTIFTLSAQDVTRLSWKLQGEDAQEIAFLAADGGWEYEQDAAFPLDTSFVEDMLDALSQLDSSRSIEGADDLSQYGLDDPLCTITVTTDVKRTLTLGSETALGGERYCSIGDGNVYLVDSGLLDTFDYELYDVLAMEGIPAMDQVTSVEVTSAQQSYTLTYLEDSGLSYSDWYTWFMDGQALDTELTRNLVEQVTELEWSSCVNFNAADLSQYGLTAPTAVVTVRYTETVQVDTGETDESGNKVYESQNRPASFTLEIGSASDTGRYARIAGSSMVYDIDAALCDTLIHTTRSELMPDEVLVMDWNDVHTVEITLNGTVHTLLLDTRSTTDADGNTTQETAYTLNGQEVDGEDILSDLTGVSSSGYAAGLSPERGEEIRFRILREHDTFPVVELVFYQYDSTKCLTTLNGQSTVLAVRSDVVQLMETVNQLILT